MSVDRDLAGLSFEATLRDGTGVCVRAIRPDDKERLQSAFARLSPRTVYQRFFHPVTELTDDDLRNLTEVDFRQHVGLVLTVGAGPHECLIASGRYVRVVDDGDTAEVAFTVVDEYQGHGAAPLLLRELAAIARRCGVRRFVALVLTDNREMLEVFRHSQRPLQESFVDGIRRVVITLDPVSSDGVQRRRLSRDHPNARTTQWRGFPDDSARRRVYARL